MFWCVCSATKRWISVIISNCPWPYCGLTYVNVCSLHKLNTNSLIFAFVHQIASKCHFFVCFKGTRKWNMYGKSPNSGCTMCNKTSFDYVKLFGKFSSSFFLWMIWLHLSSFDNYHCTFLTQTPIQVNHFYSVFFCWINYIIFRKIYFSTK